MRTPHGLMQGSPTEEFWSGDFGTEYTRRNRVDWRARIPFWSQIVTTWGARSYFEVGCNAGWNLSAIRRADPHASVLGIDINERAILQAQAAGLPVVTGPASSLAEYASDLYEMVFTCGVLIHVPPAEIHELMQQIARVSSRYVLAVEYEAEQEEEVLYRGNAERLWKRPFGALYQELGLKLVASGAAAGFDRCTYWLLTKGGGESHEFGRAVQGL